MEAWPEPTPLITSALRADWTWLGRRYGLATTFLIISLWCLFILAKDRRTYPRKLHALFMNLLLLFVSICRAATLLADPLARTHPPAAFITYKIFHGIASICVVSAYSVLLLILLETTSLRIAPSRIQKLHVLLAATAANILYLVVAYLVVLDRPNLKLLVLICHVVMGVWGIVVCVGYIVTGGRLYRNLYPSRELTSSDSFFLREARGMKKFGVMLGLASLDGAALFTVRIYYATSGYGVLNGSGAVEFLPWYSFDVSITLMEILLCVLIFTIALKAGTRRQSARVSNVQNRTATTEQLKMRTRAVTSSAVEAAEVVANPVATRLDHVV
ncbi:uncharacterized protein LOC116620272 [Nematostella vectensis]|uniref:uncharacterized protein LOC116620272 n=1 Tax=Nematostella vectensis TaxID=45351 RepID=UPI0020774972|nr:uncharacterized protein LOC116620272 [Nematostella vectensis]